MLHFPSLTLIMDMILLAVRHDTLLRKYKCKTPPKIHLYVLFFFSIANLDLDCTLSWISGYVESIDGIFECETVSN